MKTVESLNKVFVLYATNQSRDILCALHAPSSIFFDSLSHSIINEEILYTHHNVSTGLIERRKRRIACLTSQKIGMLSSQHYGICLLISSLSSSFFLSSFILLLEFFLYFFVVVEIFSSIYAIMYNLDSLIVIGFCGLCVTAVKKWLNLYFVNIWQSLSPFRFDNSIIGLTSTLFPYFNVVQSNYRVGNMKY